MGSRDSSVCIIMVCTAGVQFLAEAKDMSLFRSIQTGSGAHPASCPMGIGAKAARA
jgi:hypothetical protein